MCARSRALETRSCYGTISAYIPPTISARTVYEQSGVDGAALNDTSLNDIPACFFADRRLRFLAAFWGTVPAYLPRRHRFIAFMLF